MFEPVQKIKQSLDSYDFFPIPRSKINETYELFKTSRIIRREHISGDFVSEVLPHGIDLSRAKLLY